MKKILVIFMMTVFIYATFAAEKNMNISNKAKAVALLKSFETGDQKAVAYINPNKYIQHNLGVEDGLAGFSKLLQLPKDNNAKVNVVRSFEDGDYVFTHTHYEFFGNSNIGFDVFRFEDGLIVEHWDNIADKADKTNPSGRTQLDGTTTVKDTRKTAKNKALVADFVDTVLVKGQYDKLASFIDGKKYYQHNTDIADGIDSLSKAIKSLAEQGITMEYKTNHAVLAEGNFVLAISEGSFDGNNVSYYDLFRVSKGKIVEHWDAIEQVLPEEKWKNNNGKFGGL